MRSLPHPVLVGLALNPNPGSEGTTRWSASFSTPAMGNGVCEGSNDVQELHYRTRPAMREHDGKRVRFWRRDMEKMDIKPVDMSAELWKRVEPRFTGSPLVVLEPVSAHILEVVEWHPLRPVADGGRFGPSRPLQSITEVFQILFWNVNPEGRQLLRH